MVYEVTYAFVCVYNNRRCGDDMKVYCTRREFESSIDEDNRQLAARVRDGRCIVVCSKMD